jgi:hypothetical protein
MGVVSGYFLSSLSDGVLPVLRDPVTETLEDLLLHKGLPTQRDYEDLKNRVDMIEFRARDLTRTLNELRGLLDKTREILDSIG